MSRYSAVRRPCLIRRNRRLIVQLLSLALLFAQFGMVVHAGTHLKDDSDKTAQLCVHCLTSAPLQSMVGGGATVVLPATILHTPAIDTDAEYLAPQRAFTAFRSRGPPSS